MATTHIEKASWTGRKLDIISQYSSPHVATSVKLYVSKYNIEMMPLPLSSADLAPYNFWLFFMLKEKLRGRKFNVGSVVISEVKDSLKKLLCLF